ncbi:MAG TPA: hypothetical protein VJQ47_04275 [Steroidobacteraceae bacterium]|nr:hypothetical protein [Steroidobacteraceae bacterium]
MLRSLVVFLTLLTLPGYGFTAFAQRSCQDEMRASTQVVLAGDCCQGQDAPGTHCKGLGGSPPGNKSSCPLCKVGHGCKSPPSYELGPALVWMLTAGATTSSADVPSLLSSHSPDGLWRPPRLN